MWHALNWYRTSAEETRHSEPEVSALLAAFVRRTLDIYSSVELVWPQAYIVQVETDAEEVDEGDEEVESDVDDS